MTTETDSWLQSAFGLDVAKILGPTAETGSAPSEEPPVAATASIASGFKTGQVMESLSSAGRALNDWEEAKLDAAKGVAIKGISVIAGGSSAVASAVGDDEFAQELQAAQGAADADAGKHFDRAGEKLGEARNEVLGDDPPPTERPDPPDSGGPPTDRPPPIPPPPPTERPDPPGGGGPPTERDPRRQGDDPPPTERPDPPESGGPPTDRPPPIPPPPPTERPDPPEGGGPPTERDPRRRDDDPEADGWVPPGFPFPTPPPVPDKPPDLPPDDGPVPVPPGPEPE